MSATLFRCQNERDDTRFIGLKNNWQFILHGWCHFDLVWLYAGPSRTFQTWVLKCPRSPPPLSILLQNEINILFLCSNMYNIPCLPLWKKKILKIIHYAPIFLYGHENLWFSIFWILCLTIGYLVLVAFHCFIHIIILNVCGEIFLLK